jgi:hypothetical protein
MFMQAGIEFNRAHLLAMEAVNLLLDDEELEVDYVISQLLERELSKVT